MKIKEIIVSAIIMTIMDILFLSVMSKRFTNQIQKIQGRPFKINTKSAVMCYVLMIIVLNKIIIEKRRSILEALMLGIMVFGVYELTNKSIFVEWEWRMVIIDSIWGGVLFGTTTYLTYISSYPPLTLTHH
jgi:uncharacterized membrane protein